MKILLTGGEGMLAQDFLSVLNQFPEFECYVPSRKELDITNQGQIESIIKNYRPDILLNCAAYTNCLLYTSPSPRDRTRSRMPSSA